MHFEKAVEGVVNVLSFRHRQGVFEHEQSGTVQQRGMDSAVDGGQTVTAFVMVVAKYGAEMYDGRLRVRSTFVSPE